MDIKDFYREVDGIYANEDWEAAEELFNTAMEQTVGDPEMHAVVQNEMGVCFMKRGCTSRRLTLCPALLPTLPRPTAQRAMRS